MADGCSHSQPQPAAHRRHCRCRRCEALPVAHPTTTGTYDHATATPPAPPNHVVSRVRALCQTGSDSRNGGDDGGADAGLSQLRVTPGAPDWRARAVRSDPRSAPRHSTGKWRILNSCTIPVHVLGSTVNFRGWESLQSSDRNRGPLRSDMHKCDISTAIPYYMRA